jgi:hypothetical protein
MQHSWILSSAVAARLASGRAGTMDAGLRAKAYRNGAVVRVGVARFDAAL